LALPIDSNTTNFHFDLSSIKSAKQKQGVLNRLHYMKGIQTHLYDGGTLSTNSLDPTLKFLHHELIKKYKTNKYVAESTPMSCSAAKRWYKAWIESGQEIISLVKEHRGNSKSRLELEVREIIEEQINDKYLTPHRRTVKSTYLAIKYRIMEINSLSKNKKKLIAPSYQTILKKITRLDKFDVLASRYSYKYAAEATRAQGITPTITRNLDRVQMDHTPLDIYVDMGDYQPVRPHLTLALDAYSKSILGFWLSINPPSSDSVMNCLQMAILPKNIKALGGEKEWDYPMHGVPMELTLDNGKDFHSKDLEIACAQLGITLNFTPPRKAYFKSQIERKFRGINTSLLSNMKGQIFKKEPEKRGKDYPYLTFDEINYILLQWIVTVLHKTPNKEGRSPCDLWFESESKYNSSTIKYDHQFLALTLSKTQNKRKLGRDGINFLNLKFSSNELALLRRTLPHPHGKNPNVTFKWSANDVGAIWVFDEQQQRYFQVLATEKLSHGRSLFNHNVIQREMRARRKEGYENNTYASANLSLDRHIEEITSQKTSKSNSKISRYKEGKPKENSISTSNFLDPNESISSFDETKTIEKDDSSDDENDDDIVIFD